MPSGRVHDGVNTVLTLAVGPVAYAGGFDVADIVLFTLGSLFATYYLSPDLDLEGTRPVRRWGRLSFIWKPYSSVVPHRGISHYPIVGILTRLGYLFLVFALFWFSLVGLLHYLGLSPPRLDPYAVLKPRVWGPFLAGALFADTLHIAMDHVWSSLKRRRRKRRRRR